MFLYQINYIRDLLSKAKLFDAKGFHTPMVSNLKLFKHGVDYIHDATYYKSIVGALQHATITRPKISYDVNKVYQFMSQPIERHWIVVKRILRYLKGSLYHGLQKHASANVPLSIKAFSDDDWGVDLDDRKSTSWSCIYLGSNLVSW